MSPPSTLSRRILYKAIPNAIGPGCHLDVYLPEKTEGAPIALAFHGGGMCVGASSDISMDQVEYLLSRGVATISVEYRLAPHVIVSEIREDLLDAYKFCQERLNDVLGLKLAVEDAMLMGWSAGGTCACYLARDIQLKTSLPRPRALVLTYPLTNIDVGHFNQSYDAFLEKLKENPEEEKRVLQVESEPVCCGAPHNDFGPPPLFEGVKTPRDIWFTSVAKSGSLLTKIMGHPPPYSEDESPLQGITSHYPPTSIIFASGDETLPPDQTLAYIDSLKKHRVDAVYFEAEGMGHGPAEKRKDTWPEEKREQWWKATVDALEWALDRVGV